jgi:hypothetical protein
MLSSASFPGGRPMRFVENGVEFARVSQRFSPNRVSVLTTNQSVPNHGFKTSALLRCSYNHLIFINLIFPVGTIPDEISL